MKAYRILFYCIVTSAVVFSLVSGCAKPGKPEQITEPKVQPKEKAVTPVEKPKEEVPVKPVEKPKEQVPVKPEGKPISLALKFKANDLATYKITMAAERSVDFSGEIAKDEQFKSGKTGNHTEMTFSELIESVDANGIATAKITVKALKYLSSVRNQPAIDFDSTRTADQNNPLYKVIGQSYTITLNPNGEVYTVTGGEEIKGLVAGNLIENQAGVKLFSQEVIRKRHQVPALQDAKDKNVKVGEKWSGLKTVSFDMMGTNTYEKIYTLQQIDMKNGQEIAIVDINSMPSIKGEQAGPDLSKIFDKRSVFSGLLQLNLSTGHIEQYIEKLQAEWVIADPTAVQKPEEEPSSLKMGTMELFKLERIN